MTNPSPLTAEWRRKLAYMRKVDPEGHKAVIETIFEWERRNRRAEYESSFLAFVKRAWQELDPAPLKLAWFHEVIIEHLEMVVRGEIRSLIINAPPRTCGQVVNCIRALPCVGLVP